MIRAGSTTTAQVVEIREAKAADVAVAMRRVLQAEQAANDRLGEARRRAEAILDLARERSRMIQARADARLSRVHASYLRRIEESVADLSRCKPSPQALDPSTDLPTLASVVATVASRMTS